MLLRFFNTSIWTGIIFCMISNLIAVSLFAAKLISGSFWLQIQLHAHWNAMQAIYATTLGIVLIAILISCLSPKAFEGKH